MRTKTTSCVPVSIPFRSPGSLTYTLEAMGGNCLSQYVFSVTASATAGGKYAGGDWSQTTTNIDSIHYFNGFATDSGFGTTTSNYTYNQPYSGGTSAQPINGNQHQTTDDQVSYNYSAQTGAATLESSGSTTSSYSGGGQSPSPSGGGAGGGGSGTTWSESESGGNTTSYDYTDSFKFTGGKWTMTGGSGGASGSGNTYQWQIASGTYSSSSGLALPSPSGRGAGGEGSGSSMQVSLSQTSYSYLQHANWGGSASGWAAPTGSETASSSGWSNSY